MRRRGPGDGVVQVELLEDDAAVTLGPGVVEAADGRDAARARRLRWVGLAVMIALVGTIIATTVIDTRQDAARRSALAELGWVLPPIEGPLEEAWRAPGGWIMAVNDDVIVTQGMEGDIRALDAVTGSVLWERGGAGGYEYCSLVYDNMSADQGRYPTADTLVCVSSDQQSRVGLPEAGVIAELVAVDVPTGAEVRSLAIDGEVLMQDTVGEDLLVTFLDAEGAIGVIRWDPRAGEMWSYRSAPGVLPELGAFYTSEVWVLGLRDGVLQVTEELALDVGTGREVPVVAPDTALDGPVSVWDLPGGARAEWQWEIDDNGWSTIRNGRVLNADGSLRFEVHGEPWFPGASDGSRPDLLMTRRADGALAALDPVSGSELWSVPDMRDTRPAFQLGNTLVAVGPTTVSALDVHDGAILWQVDTGWAANDFPPTDGVVVLVQVVESGESVLVAIDLRTGTEAWRMPGPGWGYWDLVHVGGGYLLPGEREIVGLR